MAERDRRTDARAESDEGFLQRWSRRKAEARSADVEPVEEPNAPAEAGEEAPDTPAPVDLADLPDIDSLDASSDFSVFMRPGVPEHLRTQALRKMWRTDPIFSKLDGLVEYGEDYTIQSWPKGVIKTAYQIGRGFVNALEKAGEGEEQPAAPQEPEAVPASTSEPAIASSVARTPADDAAQRPAEPEEPPALASEREPAPPADSPAPLRRRPLPRRG